MSKEVEKMVKVTIQERVVLVVTLFRKGMRHKKRNKRKKTKRLETTIFKMLSLIILEMKN